MTTVSTRLVRLLNMVPYFQANPRVSYAKAAADLGLTRTQLEADINQLYVCGMPGYGPGDLIDFELNDDTIKVTFSAGIDRPLRLTSTEATGLLLALQALADIPGVVDPAAARSAIAKIGVAAGTAGSAAGDASPSETEAAAAVRSSVQDRRAVEIEYYSASRDAQSTRIVDPIRVVIVGDILHSRVARSNVALLGTLGAEVVLVAPPTLLPTGVADWGHATVSHDLDAELPAADAVMMLRVQAERMNGGFFPSEREYSVRYGLSERRQAMLPEHAVVLHPGPMLRGMEISFSVPDSSQSAVLQQVSNGVHVRMAVLFHLLVGTDEAVSV